MYTIGMARLTDLPSLSSIELAAARLLEGHAPESVLQETTSLPDLLDAQRQGLVWVVRCDEIPVGFAHARLLEPQAVHLNEIDVHPSHGRRGLGTRLVMAICAWAERTGYESVTLTTFRNVPWNMPFYAKLGFVEIPLEDIGPTLLSILQSETRRGLDPARRVAMRRPTSLV